MACVKLSLTLGAIAAAAFMLVSPSAFAADAPSSDIVKTAQISVELRNMRVEKAGEVYRFTHDRAFVETAGVGATLTQGQVCFLSGLCSGKPIEYRLEAKGEYVIRDAVLEPLGDEEQFAFTYQGEDDNGRAVNLFFRITVKGDSYEIVQ